MKRHPQKKEKGSRRTIFLVAFVPTIIFVGLLLVWRPLLVTYFFRYSRLIISEVAGDHQRLLDREMQLGSKEWRLHELERRFGQQWCKENVAPRSDVAWLTVVVNDEFIVPTLVLGHSLRTFSCQKNMIAFISKDVSEGAVRALQSVGWETRLVEEMDCNWLDAKMGGNRNSGFFAKPLGKRIRGTHTRFKAWNYTEFSKIIYLDADVMLMTNIDELFDIPNDFAATPCARPTTIDPCFNAGLMVFRPDSNHYEQIMKTWFKTAEEDICIHDQDLLTIYFVDAGNWKVLPYAYNVRISLYRPMKTFHFACCRPPKPWSAQCRPSRKEAKDFRGPVTSVDQMGLLFWKNFYELLVKYELGQWWKSTRFYRARQEFGDTLFEECWSKIRGVS
ncbi:PREDICTED: glycogenin-1-like [Acropora digitifera]|uniref:glycogenin-1-like n=1 Tax=Acropora digitifera TaxID=70779 RepID=UPI00077A1F3D|nr:PREDICTED: glycogenin-1-like [Acropora digitifera]